MSETQQLIIILILFAPIIIFGIFWMSLELLISIKQSLINFNELNKKGIKNNEIRN